MGCRTHQLYLRVLSLFQSKRHRRNMRDPKNHHNAFPNKKKPRRSSSSSLPSALALSEVHFEPLSQTIELSTSKTSTGGQAETRWRRCDQSDHGHYHGDEEGEVVVVATPLQLPAPSINDNASGGTTNTFKVVEEEVHLAAEACVLTNSLRNGDQKPSQRRKERQNCSRSDTRDTSSSSKKKKSFLSFGAIRRKSNCTRTTYPYYDLHDPFDPYLVLDLSKDKKDLSPCKKNKETEVDDTLSHNKMTEIE